MAPLNADGWHQSNAGKFMQIVGKPKTKSDPREAMPRSQLNDRLCRRQSVSFCRTVAESRWLAQRKFRFFTTETAVPEQPLVIGFAGGKSNDQRDRVDLSRYVAKNGTNRRTSLRHWRSKKTPLRIR
jgi:hypothetical protein